MKIVNCPECNNGWAPSVDDLVHGATHTGYCSECGCRFDYEVDLDPTFHNVRCVSKGLTNPEIADIAAKMIAQMVEISKRLHVPYKSLVSTIKESVEYAIVQAMREYNAKENTNV